MSGKTRIAIATGDPAGIGPEISLKAALDPVVRAACEPILVGDPGMLERHAATCGLAVDFRVVGRIAHADWSDDRRVNVLACRAPQIAAVAFGTSSADAGRAALACAGSAIAAALSGEVNAVVAAPQNETSIALAGIAFDGYPSFVARATGSNEDEVFLMLCFGDVKIVHATLHRSVRDAVAMITRERVIRAIIAADRALARLGAAGRTIAVGGLNPHAGEGGLFGREEIDIIKPAIDAAAARGIRARGPFGPDTMFHLPGFDAFVVMLHDHGHIAAKLMARNAVAALTIGTPILFSSVAHGSAHDIAGRGIASPAAMIEAMLRFCGGSVKMRSA
ncbi:MAG TPA: 4-hydroxythreonine-4-phosphate dehydrogenase PdxA [Xanthobacteraceae bacterium]